ncbi:hypothetical protein PybrP1_006075 [[Pythium] brassicae (nom. inval.)]|nr:hypothetical protein PybrP1_006075 [[Pythium] brassicae (nom. inval.)]
MPVTVKAAASGDALDRELASLAETICLSNPLTHGHTSDWQTAKRTHEAAAKLEGAFAKTLPQTFVLTEPREAKGAFAVAARAAQHPIQPMRPNRLTEAGGTSKMGAAGADAGSSVSSYQHSAAALVVAPRVRVPPAKRSHMDGVLQGLPGDVAPTRTTQADAFVHDNDMDEMNLTKNTAFHRKRDAYSEYVEARARFSKMHSVN